MIVFSCGPVISLSVTVTSYRLINASTPASDNSLENEDLDVRAHIQVSNH